MRFKIFYKFLLAISIFSLFPLIWLGSGMLKRSQEAVKTSTKEMHLNLIEGFTFTIVNEIEKFQSVADSINKVFSNVGEWGLRERILDSMVKSYPGLRSISIALPTGDEIIKISSERKSSLLTIPRNVIENAKEKGFYLFFGEDFVKYIYSYGNYFTVFEFEKEYFYKRIFFKKIGKGNFFVFNRDAQLVLYDNSAEISPEIVSEMIKTNEIRSFILSPGSGVFEIFLRDDTYIGAISCVEGSGICIGSVQRRSDAYSYVDLAKRQAIIVIFLTAIVSLFGSYLLSRMLTQPLVRFIEAARKVADKDFSVRVDVSSYDELEDLRDTFNRMVEEIEKYSKIQIERILRERKNLEAVMYSSHDGMLMIDKEWNIQLINRKALSLIEAGIDDENSLVGKELFGCIGNEKIKDAINSIKEGKNKVEVKLERGGGTEYYRVEITDIRMRESEELAGYLITFYDITYDKQLDKIKDDFLHSITHDLRNPVSAIKGFSEFLLKEIAGPLNVNQKNMIISIDRAAFRLLGMINNILDIAKMEAGKMELALTRFNVVETIYRCVDLMKILGEKKNIKFIVEAPRELFITADAGLIERIYINLIGNAIKFTPQDGVITIAAMQDGDNFKSWVEDTGEGIPLEYIDKIFEKFEQVKGQKGGGTGLGLTICRYIAEAHLGKIWAEWRPNKGAKIVFSFPINLSKDEFGRVVKV